MGNHKMGHHQIQVNSTSPRMLKTSIVEIRKQPTGIEVTQSPNVVIAIIGMETMVAPNMNVVRGGILIGSATKLGNGLGGVLTRRNLSRSSALPIATTRVVGTPQMVFTNLIMITHVNKTTY
jgi:hypothetical protein